MKRICILLIGLCLSWDSFGQSIDQLEFFFDIDPGVGNGTSIGPASPMDTLDITTTANTTGLAPGFHTFNLRAKYTDGTWGLYQKRTFYISANTQIQPDAPIVEKEFFFDTDPGPGNGPSATFATPLDSIASNTSLATDALAPGFHTLNVRAKNTDGTWGLFQKRTFFIQDSTEVGESPLLVEGQWFFDSDPGVGNPIIFPIIASDTLDTSPVAFTSGLDPGFHTLNFRFKDSFGNWGLFQKRTFHVIDSNLYRKPPPLDHISYYYFKKDSNHAEQLTQLDYSPRDELDSVFTASTTGMPNGLYYLKVWVRDTDLTWSQVATDSFAIGQCIPPNPVILVNGGNTFCFGDSVGLITDGNHNSYLWSTGDTSAFIFVNSSATISVTVDDNGCTATSEPVMLTELPELPAPSVVAIGNDSLMSSEEAPHYQWYLDATPLGLTTRKIKAPSSGIYQVQLLNDFECESDKSDFFTYWLTGLEKAYESLAANIYPNPGMGIFTVSLSAHPKAPLQYHLYNDLGQMIESAELSHTNSTFTLDLKKYPAGSYRLVIYNHIQWGAFSLLIR